MSRSIARVKAQIVGHVTAFDISTTELKSPGLEIGKPPREDPGIQEGSLMMRMKLAVF